jgi:hypothetical protein
LGNFPEQEVQWPRLVSENNENSILQSGSLHFNLAILHRTRRASRNPCLLLGSYVDLASRSSLVHSETKDQTPSESVTLIPSYKHIYYKCELSPPPCTLQFDHGDSEDECKHCNKDNKSDRKHKLKGSFLSSRHLVIFCPTITSLQIAFLAISFSYCGILFFVLKANFVFESSSPNLTILATSCPCLFVTVSSAPCSTR